MDHIAFSLGLARLGIATKPVSCRLVSGLDNSDPARRMGWREVLQKAGAKTVRLVADVAVEPAVHMQGENEVRASPV